MTAGLKRRYLRSAPPGVLREMEEHGWEVDVTGSGHLRWRHPAGGLVFSASTPSDRRSWANHLATMRRAARKVAP